MMLICHVTCAFMHVFLIHCCRHHIRCLSLDLLVGALGVGLPWRDLDLGLDVKSQHLVSEAWSRTRFQTGGSWELPGDQLI